MPAAVLPLLAVSAQQSHAASVSVESVVTRCRFLVGRLERALRVGGHLTAGSSVAAVEAVAIPALVHLVVGELDGCRGTVPRRARTIGRSGGGASVAWR